jgi:hypothetical protein
MRLMKGWGSRILNTRRSVPVTDALGESASDDLVGLWGAQRRRVCRAIVRITEIGRLRTDTSRDRSP